MKIINCFIFMYCLFTVCIFSATEPEDNISHTCVVNFIERMEKEDIINPTDFAFLSIIYDKKNLYVDCIPAIDFYFGLFLYNGIGVTANKKEGARLILESAQKKYLPALYKWKSIKEWLDIIDKVPEENVNEAANFVGSQDVFQIDDEEFFTIFLAMSGPSVVPKILEFINRDLGKTQRHLGIQFGYSQSTISRLINGLTRSSAPSAQKIFKDLQKTNSIKKILKLDDRELSLVTRHIHEIFPVLTRNIYKNSYELIKKKYHDEKNLQKDSSQYWDTSRDEKLLTQENFDLIHVDFFPHDDFRIFAFKKMCEDLAPIVKSSGTPRTCFLSYAWPKSEEDPLRSWFDAIHKYLSLAGINVIYDLEELAISASKILILLTPDYKTKCDQGTTLRNEMRIAFSKGIRNRSIVLLSGTVEQGLPFKDIKSLSIPGNELINIMTASEYRHQKETDGPDIDRFYSVMCTLLDSKNSWGLLSDIRSDDKENCEKIIQKFLKPSKLFFSEIKKLYNITSCIPDLKCFLESGQEREGGSYLDQLYQFFNNEAEQQKRQLITSHSKGYAIHGMGGVGKTTLALKYAYVSRESNLYDIIYWIPSETKDSFETGYKKFLNKFDDKVKVDSLEDDETMENILNIITRYKVLLILDNVPSSYGDQPADLFFHKILPTGKDAHILITSRKANWSWRTLNLDVFSISESVQYLLDITRLTDEENAKTLAEELGNLPLALSYAASYIKRRHISFQDYIERFKAANGNVLSFQPKDIRLSHDYPYSIDDTLDDTFKISIELLNPEEKKFLYMLSFLNPDKIYLDIFSTIFGLEDILCNLEGLSLIKWDPNNKTVSIHRLLQAVCLKNVKQMEEGEKKDIITALYDKFFYYLQKESMDFEIENTGDGKIITVPKQKKDSDLQREFDILEGMKGSLPLFQKNEFSIDYLDYLINFKMFHVFSTLKDSVDCNLDLLIKRYLTIEENDYQVYLELYNEIDQNQSIVSKYNFMALLNKINKDAQKDFFEKIRSNQQYSRNYFKVVIESSDFLRTNGDFYIHIFDQLMVHKDSLENTLNLLESTGIKIDTGCITDFFGYCANILDQDKQLVFQIIQDCHCDIRKDGIVDIMKAVSDLDQERRNKILHDILDIIAKQSRATVNKDELIFMIEVANAVFDKKEESHESIAELRRGGGLHTPAEFATESDPASSYSLPTDRLPIKAFDDQDPRLMDFEEMCQKMQPIINKNVAYFISYAWPNEHFESGRCLRSWMNAVFMYLEKAGLDVFYDTAENAYTGWLPDMKKQLITRKVIVFLTPDYDFKCSKGHRYSLSEEAEVVFSKTHTDRKFVLLCATDRQSLPEKYRGSYPPNSEALHMLTDSPYGRQQDHDVPSMNAFFKAMCNLLDPTKQWGLLYHLPDDNKPQCLEYINMFKTQHLQEGAQSLGVSPALGNHSSPDARPQEQDFQQTNRNRTITMQNVTGVGYMENHGSIAMNFGR